MDNKNLEPHIAEITNLLEQPLEAYRKAANLTHDNMAYILEELSLIQRRKTIIENIQQRMSDGKD